MDREKKIAEIRERHGRRNENGQRFAIFQGYAADDIFFLLSELERKNEVIEEQKRELFYKSKEIIELREKSWQDQQWFKQASANITEMQKELDREREENRKLREERDKLIKLLDMIKDDADRFGELVCIDVSETSLEEKGKVFNRKIETLQEERDKLIEGLRWYADAVNYEYRTSYLDQDAPIIDDSGQRARDILKEIGVTGNGKSL